MNTVNLIKLAKKCGSGNCRPDECHYEDYEDPGNFIQCMEGLIVALAERLESTITKDWSDEPMTNTEKTTNYEKFKAMDFEKTAKVLGRMAEDIENCEICPALKYCMSNTTEDEPSCSDRMKHWLESEVQP